MSAGAAECSDETTRTITPQVVPASPQLIESLFDSIAMNMEGRMDPIVLEDGSLKCEAKKDRAGNLSSILLRINRGGNKEEMYCFDRRGMILSNSRDTSSIGSDAKVLPTITRGDADPLSTDDATRITLLFSKYETHRRVAQADVVG